MGSGIKRRFIKVRISNNSYKSFMHSLLYFVEKISTSTCNPTVTFSICLSRKREEELFKQELEANDPFVQNGEQTAVLAWHGY